MAGCHELNMSRNEWPHRFCVRIRSRRIIMLSTLVMYVIMLMVLWDCGRGMTFVEASHADDDEFKVIQRAGSSIRILAASSSAGLCESIIQVAGYPCEEIKVQTSDGFILGMQHIAYGSTTHSTNSSAPRPPVFLQHGLIQGGDDWVLNPPDQSLAYMLADQGFDVWIGNMRCTRWSHGHTSLSSSNWKYWDWSFDEHAIIDMPTLVNYVRNVTGSPVYYVGHSQGTIMALAALSVAETKMSDIVKAFVLLAPIAYMEHIQSPFLTVCADIMLDVIVGWFGTREFTLYNEVGAKLLERTCGDPNVVCESLIDAAAGNNCCLNNSRVYYYLQWEPQSTSTKNLAHLAQMMRTGKFLRYDYGLAGNLANYRQLTPPAYALANIPASTRVLLISGEHDVFADSRDVARLVEEMLCPVQTLNLPNYGHADFVIGTRANVDVYMPIIAYLKSLARIEIAWLSKLRKECRWPDPMPLFGTLDPDGRMVRNHQILYHMFCE